VEATIECEIGLFLDYKLSITNKLCKVNRWRLVQSVEFNHWIACMKCD